MSEQHTVTIDRVHFTGKWVEYWFREGPIEESKLDFHECGKAARLWEVLDQCDLTEQVFNHGISGMVATFVRMGPNLEIVKVCGIPGSVEVP